MDTENEIKAWRCRGCGSTLGQVKRNGSKIRVLLLYRNAIAAGEPMKDVDVMAIVEGYVADVRCSECGKTRTWVPGEEAIMQLLKNMAKKYDVIK